MDLFVRFGEKKKRILKILVLVKIWSFFKKNTKKKANFRYFFFDPTLFSSGNRQTYEKITSAIPNDQNVGQKHFHDILIKIDGGNPKGYTPI